MALSFTICSLVASVLLLAVYLLYRAALPKPIPGIPHHEASAKRLFGDVPDMLKYQAETKEPMAFLTQQCINLNSPIVQVFVRPFGRPWVVVTDFREAQDIMVHRSKEFDRSDFFGDLFVMMMPESHVSFKTDEQWRMHRRLLGDTMSPQFLNDVASRQIYTSAGDIVKLWKEKMRLAKGRPFRVSEDVHRGALDVIWSATFGSDIGTTASQTNLLSSLDQVEIPKDIDSEVRFPMAPLPDAFNAIMTLCKSCETPMKSPIPRPHHWFILTFFPSLRSAMKSKNRHFEDELKTAWQKFRYAADNSNAVKSAKDIVVQREVQIAKKEGREAKYNSEVFKDELLGFIIAGHETTATTIAWGLKLLTTHQKIQETLRATLRAAYRSKPREMPTAQEIAKTNIPYLDAVIEEILRLGGTISGNMRVTTRDAEVLGYTVPKGTDVFLMINGPSYIRTPLQVDEMKRSQSSRDFKEKDIMWDASDIHLFMPDRWLKTDEKGNASFDSRAGPSNPFGAGPRGCFGKLINNSIRDNMLTFVTGKKLAYLELKTVFVLVILNFKLQLTPSALSNYEGMDIITHQPQQCYLRLEEA